jgi:beta-lactamase regulating signal transducer with metallopeptidase domain
MTAIELVLDHPWTARLGWTLIHFLWQGTLIAALLAAVRGLAGRWLAPRERYALGCLALAAMMAAPLLTFLAAGAPGPPGLPVPGLRMAGANWDRVLRWLVPAWIAGVAAFSVRLMAGWRWTKRLRFEAVRPAAGEWQRALDELARRMRVAPTVRLLTSSLATVPAVVGWLRPLILMPVETMEGLRIEQVRALLAHELAHIRRHDYLVNILQSMVETVLFYHPATWWVSEQIRAEREVCCDDLAVRATGDLLVYATTLADLDSLRRARLRAAMAASGGSLVKRIRRLVGEPQPNPHDLPGPGMAWALSLLWLAGVGAATVLHGAPTQPAPSASVTHRLFVALAAVTPTPVPLAPPPPPTAAPLAPVLSALLFDPFFSPPQAPAPPPAGADQPKNPQAKLEGRVVNAVDGTPIAGARVKAIRINEALVSRPSGHIASLQVAPNDYGEPLFTKTDAQGHFQFPTTPLGDYSLTAEQPGFLQSYEARGPRGPLMLLGLILPGMAPPGEYPLGTFETAGIGSVTKSMDADGSLHAVAVVPLTPYAVITGKVTEPTGLVRSDCPVEILAMRGNALTTVLTVRTDDRGEYRAARLVPGTYYVVADKSGTPTTTMRVFRTTYYPAALDAASAAPIALAAGQQSRADIRMLSTAGVNIAGTVTPTDTGDTSTKILLYQPEAPSPKPAAADSSSRT